jgi:hypothetical protein
MVAEASSRGWSQVSFAAALEQAAKEALCGWLANGGNAAAATWLINGAKTPGTAVAAAAGGLGLLALNYGCQFDPEAGKPPGLVSTGCKKSTGGTMRCRIAVTTGTWTTIRNCSAVEVYGESKEAIDATSWRYRWSEKNATGTVYSGSFVVDSRFGSNLPVWELCSGTCVESTPTKPVATTLPPYTYVDATSNCTYVVEHQAWVLDDYGTATPVLKISAGTQARASGGVIGGCNFDPVIYIPPGGGGGGIIGGGPGGVFPWTPGPDGPNGEPWWWDIAKSVAGQLIGAALNRLIDKLLEEKAPSVTYRLVSVCETDAQGEAISQSREVTIPSQPILNGLVARVDAMDDLMQGLKDFKQPVCKGPRPQGELVTVNFIADTKPPGSSAYLRKYMRYRDTAGRPEAEHAAHWEFFEWSAGPAIVTSRGAAWGQVKVWAADEAEGRRVIEHAAAIAGVDLAAPSHSWDVTAPQRSGYGQTGVMKTERDGSGTLCVSKRSGPAGRPDWALDS